MKLSGAIGLSVTVDDLHGWRLALEHERQWREALYTGPDTPLSPDARARFKGLLWYGPDPEYRVRGVKLRRLPTPKRAALQATGPDALNLAL